MRKHKHRHKLIISIIGIKDVAKVFVLSFFLSHLLSPFHSFLLSLFLSFLLTLFLSSDSSRKI